MKDEPVKVKFIKKEDEKYLIKFPHLKIPVSVNYNLYQKMRNSNLYKFADNKRKTDKTHANSA